MTDDVPGATRDLEEALALSRAIGDPLGQINALNNVGSLRHRADRLSGRDRALTEALAICRDDR